MSGFGDRFAGGTAWEMKLADGLRARGWKVAPFGQAQIKDDFRSALRDFTDGFGRPTLIRWLPDLLIARADRVALIDAKTESESNRNSPNYAIEFNALEAGLVVVERLHTPLFYVWPDGGVMTPEIVWQRWNRRLDGKAAAGSKTSFLLVDRGFAMKADEVFGRRLFEAVPESAAG
ncbi:MAG TPA: hypothetical protein VIQ30_00675 [Pseudonocardia sp.]